MIEGVVSKLRIRVIAPFTGGNSEITNDLPHLHQSTWTVVAMQPGNPGSSALGSFTIPLFPPGTEQFRAARAIYDQLRRYLRVEAYISHDGASLGKLAFTGVITGIPKLGGPSPRYELTGASDTQFALMSRPFPGEFLSNDVTSAMLKSYLGTNELGVADTFNPFTAANYTSTNLGGFTAGTWTGTTDDGFNVVSNSTGTGAILISKTGTTPNDRWHTHYVEVTGRISPSSDATNAGQIGIGISNSNANLNDGMMGFVNVFKDAGSRYEMDVQINGYVGGVATATPVMPGVMRNVDDPQTMIPFTVGALITTGGNSNGTATLSLIVNGKVVLINRTTYVIGTATRYPVLSFAAPASGSATAYFTNLIHMTRFTTDGGSTAAAFGNGTISTSTISLGYGVDPGPNFLETWTRLATRTGWYWRYTPQAYVIGTRTLGTVDFEADPGTDRTASVIFNQEQGNLVSLEFNNNADALAADTALTGQSTLDSGGFATWRDIATLQKYGVIQDEALGFTHSDFNSQRRASYQINQNKINLDTLGAKTAVVVRDPRFADTYRELDKITIHYPEMGCNYLACRIMARTFSENSPTEILILDQFSEDFNP